LLVILLQYLSFLFDGKEDGDSAGNDFLHQRVLQCNDQTLATAEMLVIQFDQEKFEQLLSMGNTTHLCMCKHKKVYVAKTSLANS